MFVWQPCTSDRCKILVMLVIRVRVSIRVKIIEFLLPPGRDLYFYLTDEIMHTLNSARPFDENRSILSISCIFFGVFFWSIQPQTGTSFQQKYNNKKLTSFQDKNKIRLDHWTLPKCPCMWPNSNISIIKNRREFPPKGACFSVIEKALHLDLDQEKSWNMGLYFR